MPHDPADVDERIALARRLTRRGALEDAEVAARTLLADLRLRPSPALNATARARVVLARVLLRRGSRRAASLELEQTLREIDQAFEGHEGAPSLDMALALVQRAHAQVLLASLCAEQGEPAAARDHIEQAIGHSLRRALVLLEAREVPGAVTEELARIARLLMEQQQPRHAERLLRLELQERERAGASLRVTSRARIHLAQCLMRQDKLAEAEGLFRTALDQRRRAGAPPDALVKALCWLAMCVLARGRPAEAEALLLDELREVAALDAHPEARAALRYSLARVNLELGRPTEAKAMLRCSIADLTGTRDTASLASHALGLARLLQADGEHEEAEVVLLEILGAAEGRAFEPGALQALRDQLAANRGERRSGAEGPGGTLQAFGPPSLGP